MSKRRILMSICNLCGSISGELGDPDTLGISLSGYYCGGGGGGPLPKDVFVCQECIVADESTLSQIIGLIFDSGNSNA